MGNGTASRQESRAKKVKRFRWTKSNAPLVLLLLSFTFMVVAIVSKKSQTVLDETGLAPYVMTALLCTLVAAATTLIGCASRQTDGRIQSAAAEATGSRKKLLRICRVGLRANRRNTTKIFRLEEGQRQLLDKLAKLCNVIESRDDTPQKAVPGCEQELAQNIAAVASSNRTIQTRIDGLLLAGKLMSGKISATADNQESLSRAVQNYSELLDGRISDLTEEYKELRGHLDGLRELIVGVGGEVSDVARGQASLHETVETGREESDRQLQKLLQNHTNVSGRLEELGESIKHGSTEAVEQFAEQVASRESFEAHAKALEVQLSGIADTQRQIREHADGLRELMQGVTGDVTNVARGQETLHEVVETLSKDHENVCNHLDQLGENVEQVSAQAVEQITQRTVSRKSFQTQAETFGVKLAGLATAQDQLRGHIEGLRELMQAVAGDVSNVTREQVDLREAVAIRGTEFVSRMETLSREVDRRLEAFSEESAGRLEALSLDHAHVHNHLDQLCENVKRASSEAAEQVAQRVASRESFQAHAEMLDIQLSGLSTAQEQLRSHVCGLREIMQGVAGDVTNVARGQATLHEAVEVRGRGSDRRLETLSDDHRNVQKHVDELGETVRQVTADAVKLVAMRVATRESFEAHSEALDTRLSGLVAAHEQLRGHVHDLKGLIQTVAGNVTDVAHQQINLHETVKARSDETVRRVETLSEESLRRVEALSEDHRNVHDHLDRLGADVRQTSSEAVDTLARQVTSSESFAVHTEALDVQLSGLATAQEQLRAHIAGLRDLVQAVSGDVSSIAREQTNLHETVEIKGAESVRHIETLSEELDRRFETLWGESAGRFAALSQDHASVHTHLDQLGENVRQTTETLSEDHRNVHDHLDRIDESIGRVGAETVDRVTQQVPSRESFQTHAEALDAQLSGLAAAHEQLRAHVDGLRELMQTVAGDVTNVAREQAHLHEAVEITGAESVRRLETLSAGHKATHVQLDGLGEAVKNVSAEAVEMFANRVASRESFQAHVEALDAQLSGLAALQEQLRGCVDNLREEMRTIAGKQATLHEAVEIGDAESFRRLEKLSEDHRAVQSRVEQLGETVKCISDEAVKLLTRRAAIGESLQDTHAKALDAQLSGIAAAQEQLRGHINGLRGIMQAVAGDVTAVAHGQASLHEAAEIRSEESVRHLETLSEDHRNIRNEVERLGESITQVGSDAVELISQGIAGSKSLQAHAEALHTELTGLADTQERFSGDVDGLRGLMQELAGDVTNIAREQTTLHEAVTTQGEESSRRLESLSEDHTNIHTHLDDLGRDVKQASAEAAETVAKQVAVRESFEDYAEALQAQMSGLAAVQEQLQSSVNAAKVNIEKITAEQASLNGTIQENATTVATTMGQIEQFQHILQNEIGNLAQASQQTITSIEALAVEQATSREIAGSGNEELASQIAVASRDQKTALAELGEDLQKAATDIASIARDQDHIENAVSGTRQESLSKLNTITADQEQLGRKVDASEARINEMVTNISNLQQQVKAVLEILNTCAQNLTDVLVSNDQQQSRLEGTINQNLAVVAELISQIQANRTCLQTQT